MFIMTWLADLLFVAKVSRKESGTNSSKEKVQEVAYDGNVSSVVVLTNAVTKPTIRSCLIDTSRLFAVVNIA